MTERAAGLTPWWGGIRLEHSMNNSEKIEELRHFLARTSLPPERLALSLGVGEADQALGGGLALGALHEVYARDWAAGGFAACLAIRAAGAAFGGKGGALFWVRPDYEALEYGGLHAQGVAELGGRPENLVLVRTANATEALAAASDILACAPVGALLLEMSGMPKALDLLASRKLNFAANASGVTAILLREGAEVLPSAAQTRWQVSAAPSVSQAGDESSWGLPSFNATLTRNRLGPTGHWQLTWSPQDGLFHQSTREQYAPHNGVMAAALFDRPVEKSRQRRAQQSEKRRIAF
jgi:protein ImuA